MFIVELVKVKGEPVAMVTEERRREDKGVFVHLHSLLNGIIQTVPMYVCTVQAVIRVAQLRCKVAQHHCRVVQHCCRVVQYHGLTRIGKYSSLSVLILRSQYLD